MEENIYGRKFEDIMLFRDFTASKKNKKYQFPKALEKPDWNY